MTFQIPQNDAVDVALDRATAPGQRQTGSDSVQVPAQSAHERVQCGQIVGIDGGHPAFQLTAPTADHHLREGSDMTGQRGELGARAQDGIETLLVARIEACGIAHHPAHHPTNRRRFARRAGNTAGAAEGVQVVEHDLLASAIAELGNLTEQLGGVGAAFIPSQVQVGLELVEQTRTATGAVVDQ
ncbi:hypothetical protein [Nocardia sp. X0981]